MSLDEEAEGARWLLEAFDRLICELDVAVRQRELRSPQQAMGEYFDCGLYLLSVTDGEGRRHNETFSEENLADLHGSPNLRGQIEDKIRRLIESIGPPGKRPIGF